MHPVSLRVGAQSMYPHENDKSECYMFKLSQYKETPTLTFENLQHTHTHSECTPSVLCLSGPGPSITLAWLPR